MILNKTTGKTISEKEKICKNVFSQSLGLMFRRKQNLVMVFDKERKIRLHNFFVFYPTDVLVLDEGKNIVEIKKKFRPFTFWNSKKKGRYVVELAFPDKYGVGDEIDFRF